MKWRISLLAFLALLSIPAAADSIVGAIRTIDFGTNNGDIRLRVKKGGTPTDVLTVHGSDAFVGIGATTPVQLLDMRSAGTNTGAFVSVANSNVSEFVGLGSGRSGDLVGRLQFSSALTQLDFGTSPDNTFASVTPLMTLLATGKLGIGTQSPGNVEEIKTTSSTAGGSGGTSLLLLNNTTSSPTSIEFKTGHPSDFKVGSSITENGAFEIYSVGNAKSGLVVDSSGRTGLGVQPATSAGILQARQASDIDLIIAGAGAVPNAVSINAVNDANTANIPLEVRSSATTFSTGNVTISNTLTVSAAGGNVPHTCVRRSASATSVSCSGGEIAVGGGCNDGSGQLLYNSSPNAGLTAWTCSGANDPGMTSYAVCCSY